MPFPMWAGTFDFVSHLLTEVNSVLNPVSHPLTQVNSHKWKTPEGHAIICKIVEEQVPEWPGGLHNWQVTVVAWILDGEDALCITATRDGKSAIFAVPMIVLLEVARNPTKYPGFTTGRKKPVGIVNAPTKGLSTNIVYELTRLRVPALAYTSETVTEARKIGRNLTAEIAECHWAIICVDPEHLIDKQWEHISDSPVFRENVMFAGVDEVHLIDEWGADFCPAFHRIGPFVRGRLPPQISIFGLSATLQPGSNTNCVCQSLGFQPNMFHLLRRSNERTNIQFLITPLTHGLGGDEFPDLLQYLPEGRKTIIYCATIELCWRVFVYLIRLLPPGPHRLRRIRLYHAMCWPDENEEIVKMIRDDPFCQIIVATVAFGQGFTVKSLFLSLQLRVPQTVAQALQQGGRVTRDPATIGRTVILAQASAYAAAGKYLEARSSDTNRTKASKNLTTMNNEKALMLTTKQCLISFFNKLYGNNTPGALVDCVELPRRFPCSNCLPRFIGPLYFPFPSNQPRFIPFTPIPATGSPNSTHPSKPRKLKKKMRTVAEGRLREFKDHIYSVERDNIGHGFTSAEAYFSNSTITSVLDNFFQITSLEVLSTIIPRWKFHSRHGPSLLDRIGELQRIFAEEFEAARIERNEKNRLCARSKLLPLIWVRRRRTRKWRMQMKTRMKKWRMRPRIYFPQPKMRHQHNNLLLHAQSVCWRTPQIFSSLKSARGRLQRV
ncbi:P-loop containing nucleoside triphosphate hydrolase protein [Mycena sanguinolenta]|nr:P-loop containing nucleoside triphosphate hydrolase protein [Mycena sanguinolenta]